VRSPLTALGFEGVPSSMGSRTDSGSSFDPSLHSASTPSFMPPRSGQLSCSVSSATSGALLFKSFSCSLSVQSSPTPHFWPSKDSSWCRRRWVGPVLGRVSRIAAATLDTTLAPDPFGVSFFGSGTCLQTEMGRSPRTPGGSFSVNLKWTSAAPSGGK